MKVAICENDKICCSQINQWLEEYKNSSTVDLQINIYENAEMLLEKINHKISFDVIFLDIGLSGNSGIELAKAIRRRMQKNYVNIIFISGKVEYCTELFDMEPLNFHQKPLNKKEILQDIDKAVERYTAGRIVLKCYKNGVPKKIQLRDIMYMAAEKRQTYVMTYLGEEIIVKNCMQELEQAYTCCEFCRCHRAYLVNLSYVKCYRRKTLCLKDEIEIPIDDQYVDNVKRSFALYDFWEE